MPGRILLVIGALVVASCTAAAPASSAPPTTDAPIGSTTAPPVTTSAEPHPTQLTDAPAGWEEAVADVYGAACGGDRSRARAELAMLPPAEECPRHGDAASAAIGETVLVVAEIGDDVFYGVGSADGFVLAAARVPSLGQKGGWYGIVPKLVAVVGSDARPGQDPASARADSIHLVGFNGSGLGGIVGIPRDSWVPIAGGGSNKINAALSRGGPETMMATLAGVSGLALNGYILTGFEGFQELWGNVLGGADLELSAPVVDRSAGANLGSGLQYLNGPDALALARARKSLAGGDLSRSFNGGTLLLAALGGLQVEGPLQIPQVVAAAWPWLVTDLDLANLLSMAALALDTPLAAIGNKVAPGRVGTAGPASVVYLTDEASAVFADLADGTIEAAG